MIASFLGRLVALCVRYAPGVVLLGLVLGSVSGVYSARHLRMDSDPASLVSKDLPWRQHEINYDKTFPGKDGLTLVVIDAATPGLADTAAKRLQSALAANKQVIRQVRNIQGGSFFSHAGLLLAPLDDVKRTVNQLIEMQPFLGPLAQDPSLRGLMDTVSTVLEGVRRGQTDFANLKKPLSALSDTLAKVEAGKLAFLSWQGLMTNDEPDASQSRRLLQVYGVLDHGSLEPGTKVSTFIRHTAQALHLTPAYGVRVRLTGPVPLADDELASLSERVGLIATLMVLFILGSLWLALRSWRMISCVLVTMVMGLAITTALGLVTIGTFNIISVAFIPLFVGIGVDFAIQFSVRYRAERYHHGNLDEALKRAGVNIGVSLSLAAAATAVAFFSFLPTNYAGVAQLGLIAGMGIVVAFGLAVTLLPALLKLVRPRAESRETGFISLAVVDELLGRNRRVVLVVFALLAVLAASALPFLRFDFNPMNLRNDKLESVATLQDLTKDPQTSPNTIDVLAPSLAKARLLVPRLEALPEVDQVLTIESFIPRHQTEKLALISNAAMLLDTTLDPFFVKPAPTDAETVASLRTTAKALQALATADPSASGLATRFAATLDKLSAGQPALRHNASQAIIPGFNALLGQLRGLLHPHSVSLDSIPADFKRDWIAPNGEVHIVVMPKANADADDNRALAAFGRAVLSIAPNATGVPISIRAWGSTIVGAFAEAAILSFIALVILLTLVLRNARDVVLALLPLILAGMLTLATCVVIGLPLNYANIIALPLLLGLGVSFDIYFVMANRQGQRHFLQSSLARAVIFSAATTATGFGALWVSSHPGTASMGELLLISLGWTLVCVLFFLPALAVRNRSSARTSAWPRGH